jgi:hypothetical protein
MEGIKRHGLARSAGPLLLRQAERAIEEVIRLKRTKSPPTQ